MHHNNLNSGDKPVHENQLIHENRLIHEKSPYLLQHAHNPVNWMPWSLEAFERAKNEDKPVLLSVGYSTCHWCHVMAHESFEDEEAAAVLNRDFVAIKVDREERPDIDAIYMAACQAMTGSGGWPLTVLMTWEQKPFWAGTYLPKNSQYGRLGLIELLTEVMRLWKTDKKRLIAIGETVTSHISGKGQGEEEASDAELMREKTLLHEGAAAFSQRFDERNGGFGSAPKFPTPHNLLFLMRYGRMEGNEEAMRMAKLTLTQMARGGIFDQIGGGFSRYSTDESWLAPHFEKMLYDNGLLAYSYLEAYQITKEPFYRQVAERTLDYVLRELTDPEGGFYCGQDADSEGEEGKYYVFTPREVCSVLGQKAGAAFCQRFDITEGGNFEGKSIPNLLKSIAEVSGDREGGEINRDAETAEACKDLLNYRKDRTRLHRDDKILTSWNGLMIAALAKAYRVLGNNRYLDAAQKARAFIGKSLTTPEGGLWLRFREGQAAIDGQLDDYVFLSWALLELYTANFDPVCLADAARLMEQVENHFRDREGGGFYLTSETGEMLISRPKECYDGAIPSGNSVAALVMLQLYKLTGEPVWNKRGCRQLAYLAKNMKENPMGSSFSLLALSEAIDPSRELVCAVSQSSSESVGAASGSLPEGLRELVAEHRLHTLVKTKDNAAALEDVAPFTKAYPIPTNGAAFYLCQNGACNAPVYSLEELKQLL